MHALTLNEDSSFVIMPLLNINHKPILESVVIPFVLEIVLVKAGTFWKYVVGGVW